MAAESARDKGDTPFLLYGANGYTGELIAEDCARRNIPVVLAGRREEAIRPLAERLSLSYRVFPLDDVAQVARELGDFPIVLLAAGPFSKTSAPVIDACLRTGTHYTDITGELEVFEAIHARDAEAKSKGCVLMPGVGFDVVPTDCLAARLAEELPGAKRLMLAFHGTGSASRGTLKTMIENAHRGGAIRRDGRIERVAVAWKRRTIAFHDRPRDAMTIPWGDVSTAYYSTGIPNIEVYLAMPPRAITAAKLSRPFGSLLGTAPVQRFLRRRVDARAPGPTPEERRRSRSELWGRVEAADGRSVDGTLTTPEGYELTAESAIECTLRIARGEARAGALTPSSAFGWQLLDALRGCELRVPARSS